MSTPAKGKQGTATSVVTYSPARRKRREQGRKRQEARWAARSGQVHSHLMTPEERARYGIPP